MCDTVVRVDDNGVWFAKNSDRDVNESQVLTWIDAARHTVDDRQQCTYIDIPQVPITRAAVVSRPFWMWGAEMGVNDAGVAIGNEAVFTDQPLAEMGLTGMDLVRLALVRSATANDAVATIIGLLEAHGQGGGCGYEDRNFSYHNSFLIADRNEAWVVETAGTKWATEQVTTGVRSISNGLTIPAFAAAHADRLRGAVVACASRARSTSRSATAAVSPGETEQFLQWFAVCRDHGTPARGHNLRTGAHGLTPAYRPLAGGLTAPCAHPGGFFANSQTTNSWVSRLSDNEGGDRHFSTGTAAPCTSTFVPVHVASPWPADIVGDESRIGGTFDARHKWWRHEVIHRFAMADPNQRIARFRDDRDRLERDVVSRNTPSMEALKMVERSELRWLADLAGSPPADTRSRLVRYHVDKRAKIAGIPAPGVYLTTASAENITAHGAAL